MERENGFGHDGGKPAPYLSPLNAWALAFGCAVGWGAFVMPGNTFLPMAGPLGSLFGFVLGAAFMLVIGVNYRYMMARFPDAGGSSTYAREVFGHDHGFLCAWFSLLTYVAIAWANATAIVLVARNLLGPVFQFGFHYTLAGYDVFFGEALVTMGALLLFGAVCCLSRRLAAVVQTVMALLLAAGILVCFGAAALKHGGKVTLTPYFVPGEAPFMQVFGIAALAPWAFVGFESIAHSAGEFRFSPKKSLRIMTAAVIAAALAYILLVELAVLALPGDEYASWTEWVADLGNISGLRALPVFFAARETMGDAGILILGVTLLGGVVTGLVGNFLAASRLLYSLAREGVVPRRLGALNREGAPAFAILAIVAASIFIPFVGRTAIGWIVDVTTICATVMYGYTSAAAYKLARGNGDGKICAAGIAGIAISILFSVYLLLPAFWGAGSLAAESYLILAVWCIAGFVYFRRVFRRDTEHRFGKSTVVWVGLLFLIFFVSSMWMRQSTQVTTDDVARAIDAYYAGELKSMDIVLSDVQTKEERAYLDAQSVRVRDTLTRNGLIQMVLTVMSLSIMFSVYSIMRGRQRELEMEKFQAEESNKAKSAFLSNMSHEIRTPINAVLGMNEMIIRESGDERITSYARNVESAGRSLLSLINDILDFSKIEAGRMEIAEAGYKLSSVLNDVTNMVSFKARAKGLRLDVQVDGTMPDGLFGDEVRVRQVMTNLLNNAVKYTQKGTVTFSVSGERLPDDAIRLVCRVEDTGIGIRSEDLPRLFEKFERVDLNKNKAIEGTGLGLSITRSLLELMGGDIRVESVYGAGSAFTARIPQRIVSREPIGDFHEKFERYIRGLKGYHESFRAPDARILAVDDTDMNLTVIEGLLKKTQIQIDTAPGGAEALEKARGMPYDVILMDHRMPQMDGTQALELLRRQKDGANLKTPVICLTADAVSGAKERFIAQGFTDYLSKPVDGAALEAILIQYLPAEKVLLEEGSGDSPAEGAAGGSPSELEAFYARTEGLDYAEAIRNCANEEVLARTLRQFCMAAGGNAEEIARYAGAGDWRNYTVKVHALKSSARLIGAAALSEDARVLEECGNDPSGENLRRIGERTPRLLADYGACAEKLGELWPGPASGGGEDLPGIPPEKLRELYAAIREAAETFDSDAIDGIVAEAAKYRVPEGEAERFAKIEKCARDMDWDGLEDALGQISE